MIDYSKVANQARKKVLSMIHHGGTSHIGSNFSVIDLLTVLYLKKKQEDEIIVSKGWAAASVYFFLSVIGVIPEKDLDRFCQPDETKYIGLAEPMAGIRFAGGSMCLGLAAGVGLALAKKIKKEEGSIYVVESDGGMNGGITWEALAIAAHHKLDNLFLIIDKNGFQAMGKTEEVLNLEPLDEKLKAFGWEVRKCNGHDFGQIEKSLTWPRLYHDKPVAIIASTIKGKGVSWMENKNLWHYAHLEDEDYQKALAELNAEDN